MTFKQKFINQACRGFAFLMNTQTTLITRNLSFLTDLEHTRHGHLTGLRCRLISSDNSKRYLKYRKRFENFNLESIKIEHCSLKLVDLIMSEILMYWSVKSSQCYIYFISNSKSEKGLLTEFLHQM